MEKNRTVTFSIRSLLIGIIILLGVFSFGFILASTVKVNDPAIAPETIPIVQQQPISSPTSPNVTKKVNQQAVPTPVVSTAPAPVQPKYVDCTVYGSTVRVTEEECSKRQADYKIETDKKYQQAQWYMQYTANCRQVYLEEEDPPDYTGYNNCLSRNPYSY